MIREMRILKLIYGQNLLLSLFTYILLVAFFRCYVSISTCLDKSGMYHSIQLYSAWDVLSRRVSLCMCVTMEAVVPTQAHLKTCINLSIQPCSFVAAIYRYANELCGDITESWFRYAMIITVDIAYVNVKFLNISLMSLRHRIK